jgi:hypothetical protein
MRDVEVGKWGYIARYGHCTPFRIIKIEDNKATLQMFPLDQLLKEKGMVYWGSERIYSITSSISGIATMEDFSSIMLSNDFYAHFQVR